MCTTVSGHWYADCSQQCPGLNETGQAYHGHGTFATQPVPACMCFSTYFISDCD